MLIDIRQRKYFEHCVSVNQSVKKELYSAMCSKRIRGASRYETVHVHFKHGQSVRPVLSCGVCLSVTFVYCIETAKDTATVAV